MTFSREMLMHLDGYLSPQGPCWEIGGGSFEGIFERKENCICVSFLDTEVIEILSLGGHLELW
jgi:hypothetical protein